MSLTCIVIISTKNFQVSEGHGACLTTHSAALISTDKSIKAKTGVLYVCQRSNGLTLQEMLNQDYPEGAVGSCLHHVCAPPDMSPQI